MFFLNFKDSLMFIIYFCLFYQLYKHCDTIQYDSLIIYSSPITTLNPYKATPRQSRPDMVNNKNYELCINKYETFKLCEM